MLQNRGEWTMAEYFDTAIVLEGEHAKKFRKYDADSMAFETEESKKIAKRARKIAKTLAH